MRIPSRRTLILPVLVAVLLPLGGWRSAQAQPLPVRTTGINSRGTTLVVSVGLQDLFTPAARERLTSGFSTRVLIRAFLRREGDPEPVAVAFQRAEIVYDIWDEKFRVRVTRGPGTDRTVEAATVDQAISLATALWQFPIIERTQLKSDHRYFLAVRGDLNPLSIELQAEVRRWLRQPAGAQRRPGAGGGDSFFGSFVTVFVNPQIEDSENQLRFVSQTFLPQGP
ncbi:MAG: DUF4390 domain-containing protein [Deltaproteobacteria bacterium]|nr:DUF4390 domain-containing protein [Deltaproteobacteria bacterium]